MTAKKIATKLPNPDSNSDPGWTEWDKFILSHGIPVCNEEVVRRYQNIEQDPTRYLEARLLNHFLNLRQFGLGSRYAALSENDDQEEEGHPVQESIGALDIVFANKACRFTANSVVYKGVCSEPFYEIHNFEALQEGDVVQFHGFVSTSACREKALDFVRQRGVLLVVQGLNLVDCIVPENLKIQTTINADVPEHEILLHRGVSMKVQQVVPCTSLTPLEVHLQVSS